MASAAPGVSGGSGQDHEGPSGAVSAAAATAARIAAAYGRPTASTTGSASSPGAGAGAGTGADGGKYQIIDGDYVQDIEVNDLRNRYLLTKGSTQTQIHKDTGADVTTRGKFYPDKAMATEKDPPLFLRVTATSVESLQSAVEKIQEMIDQDLGPLTEDRSRFRRPEGPRERPKWPEEKVEIGLEPLRNFNVRAKVVGPGGIFVKYIQAETGTRVQVKGLGSGFYEQESGQESQEPMHIHVAGPEQSQVAKAKELVDDLLEVVRGEHEKYRLVAIQFAPQFNGGFTAPLPVESAPLPQEGHAPLPSETGQIDQQTYENLYYAYCEQGYDPQTAAQYAQYYASQSAASAPPPPPGPATAPPPPEDNAPPPPPPDDPPPTPAHAEPAQRVGKGVYSAMRPPTGL